jgi:LysR family glycine cleavage system transcriptional activator
VALARSVLVRPELEAGRLVRPVPHSVPAAFAYYVVHPAGVSLSGQLAALHDWLLAQAKTVHAEAEEVSRA